MGRRPDGGPRGGERSSWPMTCYVRTVAWTVVALLLLALAASLVLDGR